MTNNSLQTQLNNVLNDLESTYLDLVGGKVWAGFNASPTKSLFVAGSTNDDEITDTKALAALKKILFDEWAKLHAVCHHCSEKGHICPHCSEYIDKSSWEYSSPHPRHIIELHLLLNHPVCPTLGMTIQRIKRQKQSGQLPSKTYSTTIASTNLTAMMATIATREIKTRMNCPTTKPTRTCAAFFLWLVI